MYLIGQGHEHLGPGTSMSQRINWTVGQEEQLQGLGCTDCDGACGGCSKGLGLFETGMDWTGWGLGEWATLAFGAYVLFSISFTTQRGVRRVAAAPGEYRKRKAKRLRKEASALTAKRRN